MSNDNGRNEGNGRLETEQEQLELLYKLLHYTLSSDSTPVQVGEQALGLIVEAFAILRGEIFALNQQQRLVLLAAAGYETDDPADLRGKIEQRLQHILIGEVQRTGQEVIIPDVNCQEYWLPIPGLDDEICSVAALPLSADGQVIGILTLLSDQVGYFTAEQLPLLKAVAHTVALALKNAFLFAQVRAGQNQLRRLAEQLINVQEEERRRVSHALHDETGQALTMLHLSLNAIRRKLPPDGEAQEKVNQADKLLTETMSRIRRLAYDLRPPELDTLGLNATLASLCQEFDQHTQFEINYSGTETPPTLPDSIIIAFYRFLQEALTNVAKHAAATQVDVQFAYDGEQISLQVKDNGRGFDFDAAGSGSISRTSIGLGLLGMRERFENLHGHLDIESSNETGTKLTAIVPWSM